MVLRFDWKYQSFSFDCQPCDMLQSTKTIYAGILEFIDVHVIVGDSVVDQCCCSNYTSKGIQ